MGALQGRPVSIGLFGPGVAGFIGEALYHPPLAVEQQDGLPAVGKLAGPGAGKQNGRIIIGRSRVQVAVAESGGVLNHDHIRARVEQEFAEGELDRR